jgi:hypothetical protein
LHNNYTFNGPKIGVLPSDVRFTNHTLEITHGFTENFEIGFYTFTRFNPNGRFEYLGNQIRPHITVPTSWGWKCGVSISAEFGFFRPTANSSFQTQGEIRPIIDRTWGKWYVSLNPNIDFVSANGKSEWGIAPQTKVVYTIAGKYGVGLEYYTGLGSFSKIEKFNNQEHLLGPIFDLYTNPSWELQTGVLFGITPGSNQQIFKLLVGKRISWK